MCVCVFLFFIFPRNQQGMAITVWIPGFLLKMNRLFYSNGVSFSRDLGANELYFEKPLGEREKWHDK